MLELVRTLRTRVAALDKSLRKLTSKQMTSQPIRREVQGLVDMYFRDARPAFLAAQVQEDTLAALDLAMRVFLEISHRSVTIPVYRAYTKSSIAELEKLEKSALLNASRPSIGSKLDEVDQRIASTLASMVPSAALSFEQACNDLRAPSRLSWRGPATDLREALRETLDHLAPDAQVETQVGFRLEKDARSPTMKQKVRFVLTMRGISKTASQSPENAVATVDEIVGSFVRSIYNRSSLSTHTPTDKDEVLRVRDWVRVALCELLEIRM